MTDGPRTLVLAALVLVAVACGPSIPPLVGAPLRTALSSGDASASVQLDALTRALDGTRAEAPTTGVAVDYPLADTLFPPGFVPPTFLWHDATSEADAWLVRVEFAAGEPLLALAAGPAPAQGWIDARAQGTTNSVYEPTPHQASAHAWMPPDAVWDEIQRRSVGSPAEVVFHGFATDRPDRLVSSGSVRLTTSEDEVGAPIFYRDVPLMPAVSEEDGVIKPLSDNAIPIIEWRLRDTSRKDSKVVLTGMPTCANCHSFSLDGKTMGMDVDGPTGDKGSYGIAPVAKRIVLDDSRVITWNSFGGKDPGHHTIGFLSRVSPDGRFALSTLNEALYVSNFADHRFLQVFFPTRGILAWHSRETQEMKALPGADDVRYVHTNGVWTPDGKTVVFSRAEAFDSPKWEAARYPNDEREPKIHYDLYRIPFDEGRGGTPEPIEGASDNGWSNTFPKVSPDGKWVVFTRCKNGQLLRPDGRLCIVPVGGGEVREMRCNQSLMNSWHSFSPNSRWMVFSSKANTPYTQMFLTHIDDDGNDTPAILIPGSTAANRAVNLPEFLNAPYDALDEIAVPATGHAPRDAYFEQAVSLLEQGSFEQAIPLLENTLRADPSFVAARVNLAVALRRTGRLDASLAEYTRVLLQDPAEPRARGTLGLLQWSARNQAAATAENAAGSSRRPAIEIAVSLALKNEVTESVERLIALLDANRGDGEAQQVLTLVQLSVGDVGRAVVSLRRLLANANPDPEVLKIYAWLLAASPDAFVRDGPAAVDAAVLACQTTGERDPDALDALAAALAETGRFRDAVAAAHKAVRVAGTDRPELARAITERATRYQQGKRINE